MAGDDYANDLDRLAAENELAWASCPTPSCDGRVRDPAVEGVTIEDTCPVCGRRFAFESEPEASGTGRDVTIHCSGGGTPPGGGLPPGGIGGGIAQRVVRIGELNINIPDVELGAGGNTNRDQR